MTKAIAIDDAIKSMRADAYYNKEVLPEMLSLQEEISELTFGEKGKRIYEVSHYFQNRNLERGRIAEPEVIAVTEGCEQIATMIGREIAGTSGETAAVRSLKTVKSKHRTLSNIELKDDDSRAELDAVVITRKAIFLIEVKNSGRDMVIDKRGNYFRAEGAMDFDYNIGEKINIKEYLLRQAIACSQELSERPLNIVNIVAFANSKMHIENRYQYVKTCHLSRLPHIIDEYEGNDLYSFEDMYEIAEAVKGAECHKKYPVEFDFNAFIRDFALAKAKLDDVPNKLAKPKKQALTTRLRRWLAGGIPAEAMQ